jgi:FAD/FMN-containing dehydrogenase
MDQIVQFNQEDMDVVVQPSIGWQDLNEQLNKMGSGLFFPVDPGESVLRFANIGTNSNRPGINRARRSCAAPHERED